MVKDNIRGERRGGIYDAQNSDVRREKKWPEKYRRPEIELAEKNNSVATTKEILCYMVISHNENL